MPETPIAATEPATQHKSDVRARVWAPLRAVAVPDSRFNLDFGEYITDFAGSARATDRLCALLCYRDARVLFVAPDNCLEDLRRRALRAGKRLLVTTYGIRRGFVLLDPAEVKARWAALVGGEGDDDAGGDAGWVWFAATLDGMERLGRPVTLQQIREGIHHHGDEKDAGAGAAIPLMVTGTGAVNDRGVRFGKGHGYFDLEWAMLGAVGAIDLRETRAVALIHDCQLLLGEKLRPEPFDTVCDFVVTPERTVAVDGAQKPTCGILWDMLQEGMLEDIPPLRELKEMQGR